MSQKTHNPTESADVGTADPVIPTPYAGATATLTGMVSLDGAFQVKITFDKAATLTEADIQITPAGAGYVDSNSLLPVSGENAYTVTIHPTAGAKMITVTIC